MKKYKIKDWEKLQHYKDRNPPWIKLHRDLLTSDTWVMSGDHEKALAIGLMMLAAKTDNCIPADEGYIQKVLHLDKRPNLAFLLEQGFIEATAEQVLRESPWPSRHIPKAVRRQVMERDEKCKHCGAIEGLEIDHITPVSKGGVSEIDNLQVLCRSCNRRKRVSVASATQRHQVSVANATQFVERRSLETEGEEEVKKELEVKSKKAARVSLEELSVEHIASWLAEKRGEGKFINHDEYFILEKFKDYCRSKGKKYVDYIAAYRNAFGWRECQPSGYSVGGRQKSAHEIRGLGWAAAAGLAPEGQDD